MRRRIVRVLFVLALAWPVVGPARTVDLVRLQEMVTEALQNKEHRQSLDLLDAYLDREDISPRRRQWAMGHRVFTLQALGYHCEGAEAAVAYLARPDVARLPADARKGAEMAGRSMERECMRLQVKEKGDGCEDPNGCEESDSAGRGTLTAGTGGIGTRHGTRRIQTSFEGSLGLRTTSRLDLDLAVALHIEGPLLFIARPGLRVRLFEPLPGGAVQFRLAAQLAIGGPLVGLGGLAGLGLGIPISDGWGVQTGLDASLWPEHTLLAFEGRLGVYFGF